MRPPLFEEVVSITEEYLGPASKRFVVRQIAFHLKKAPEELAPEDIPKLVEWVKVTLSLLTEDQKEIENYASKVSSLAKREVKSG